MARSQLLLLFTIGFTFFAWGLLGVVLGPLLPEIRVAFDLTSTAAGTIFFLWSVGFSLGSFGSRAVLDRVAPLPLLAGLGLCASAAAVVLHQAPDYLSFAVAFLCIGLAGGATFTAGHTLIGRAFVRRRVAALSALDIVFSTGNIAAPIAVIALLSAGYSWTLPFLGLAALFALGSGICGLAMVFTAPRGRDADGSEEEDGTDTAGGKVSLGLLAVASFALGWIEQGQHVWLVSFGISSGQDENVARLGHAAFLAGMLGVRLLAVILDQRMQSALVLRTLFAVIAAGFAILVLGRSPSAYLVGSTMMGAGIGALFPVFLGRATGVDPKGTATFSMVMIVSIAVGGQLASLGLGLLADLGDIVTAFWVNGLIVVLLVLAAERFRHATGAEGVRVTHLPGRSTRPLETAH
ncbi:MFS transporter [Jannaschia marina]|uniref:MFS transporter n=1 Tax=Jannaschia marina TaxID=2741674 RepID=UPI0015C723BD|nr:MFS transporter [Jannaschia marina]